MEVDENPFNTETSHPVEETLKMMRVGIAAGVMEWVFFTGMWAIQAHKCHT